MGKKINNLRIESTVYKIVKDIPRGKVMTYGQIAGAIRKFQNPKSPEGEQVPYGASKLQKKISPRYVGYILHNNPDPEKILCHRVVDRNGRLAENYAFAWSADNHPLRRVRIELKSRKGRLGGEGWKEQRKKLIEEGVKFKDEMHVDLGKSL
jgi:methylated-DNA-protein-cysteine methyltransferase-like protein